MALVACEDFSFDYGDSGGGNGVYGNEDECNEDGFVVLSWCWFDFLVFFMCYYCPFYIHCPILM